jgi:hypothetical protein
MGGPWALTQSHTAHDDDDDDGRGGNQNHPCWLLPHSSSNGETASPVGTKRSVESTYIHISKRPDLGVEHSDANQFAGDLPDAVCRSKQLPADMRGHLLVYCY